MVFVIQWVTLFCLNPYWGNAPAVCQGTGHLLLALLFRWDVKPKSWPLVVMTGSTVNQNRREEVAPTSQIYLSMNKCDGKCPMTGRSGSLFSLCTLYTLLCAAGLQTKGLPHQETGSSHAAEQCLDSRLKILSHVLTLNLIIDFAWTLKFLDSYMECHKTVLSLVFFDWKMLSVRMLLVLRYLETVYWSRVGSICRMAKDRWIMYFVRSY